jgi:predicted GTPase
MVNYEDDIEYSMILVMGVTGSGKSYFVNKLQAGAAVEGHNLNAGRSKSQAHDDR